MRIDSQQIREFREVYLVSNTPLYLYKRLRRLPAVQQIAQTQNANDLVDEYIRRASAERRTSDDVSVAYACLVAIPHKAPQEATAILRSLDVERLDWASRIRDLYFAKVRPAQSHSITITAPAIPRVRLDTNANASTSTVYQFRPKVKGKANI